MTTTRGRLRALQQATSLIVRRRARRDLGLLVTVVALIAVASMLAIAGPRLVLQTVDGGVQTNVASAGSRADILLSTSFADSERSLSIARDLPGRLPTGLAQVYSGVTLTVLSADGPVESVDGAELDSDHDLATQVAMLTSPQESALRLVEGRLPAATADADDPVIEIVLSEQAAAAADLEVGADVAVQLADESKALVTLTVVGIVAPKDAAATVWSDLSELWTPFERARSGESDALTRFTVLATPDGVDSIAELIDGAFSTRLRVTVDPDAFTVPTAALVADELPGLSANGSDLIGANGGGLEVHTDLTPILTEYPIQARAALAQMSVMMAGVIGIAGIVVILLTRLLVVHRAGALALERARGASVISVGFRSLVESLVLTLAGLAVGIVLAQLVLPGDTRDPGPVVVVALIALLAGPIQAMALVRAAWTGRREPANRQDRTQLIRRAQVRRAVVELAVVALAAGALVSLRNRGLLQTRTDGIDPFLALAPLLLAIAMTVVVVRLYPVPVQAAAAIGRRSRGALGILGAVRAQQSIAVLPLLAITLGASLAVSGGLLVDTVRTGQEVASWERVGAEVRIDAELDAGAIDTLRSQSGVEVVSATLSRPSVGLDLGTSRSTPTVIAIDSNYPDLVDGVPGMPSSATLRLLGAPVSATDPLPIVVDAETARLLISKEIGMYYGPKFVPVVVVGTTDVRPIGYLDGPFAYVDLESLSTRMPEPLTAKTMLLIGPGAVAAAESLALPVDAVLTRADWLDARRGLALVAGVERTMIAAVLAVGVLAAIALVATVVGGARARGRALAMLRTLGMNPRLGWWLALSELAPMVVAAVIGGIAAGVVVVAALAPSLGLDLLAGGVSIPAPSISSGVFISLAAGAFALLLIGALADVLSHRRDKLSEVLRVGDTV